MENKNIILIAIIVLAVAIVGIVAFSSQSNDSIKNATDTLTNITNNTTKVVNHTADVNKTVNHTKNATNKNTTYKVYNPQSDSYVTVIGEKYDDEVNRWYTYDSDGVRYYNTRIK